MSPQIVSITDEDLTRVVELNAGEVQWTSPMNVDQLGTILSCTCYAKTIKSGSATAGFLIAMDQRAKYENGNFDWFKNRYERFCYVDRIVIDIRFAGKGLGPLFYEDLFAFAQVNDLNNIVCEYNIEPLNEPSMKFHQRMGFAEVGQRTLESKTVSMQARTISQS